MRAIINNLIAIAVFLLAGFAAASEESFVLVDAPRGSTALGMRAAHPECQTLSIPAYLERFAEQNGIENSENGFRHIWPGQWKLPIALTPTETKPVVETAPAAARKRANIRVEVLEPVVVDCELALPAYYAFAPVRSSEVEQIDGDELETRHEAVAKQAELESLRQKIDSLTEANDRLAGEKIEALAVAERLKREQAARLQSSLAPIVVESRVSNDSSPSWWLMSALGVAALLWFLTFLVVVWLNKRYKKEVRKGKRCLAEMKSLEQSVEEQRSLASLWESRWRTERAEADLKFYTFRLKGMVPEEIRFAVDQVTVREVPGCRGSIPVEELEDFLRELGPGRRQKMGILKFPEETEASPEVVRFLQDQDRVPKALALIP